MDFKKRVNGSWTDTPNYIYNTFTDTITTLPADIYPTGTTATVDLKGNMEQNGTPTPDSPITPSECGDLETVGVKAGQYKIPISLGGNNLFSGEFSQFDNVGGTGNIYTYFYIPADFTLTLIAKDTHTIPDKTFLGITKNGGQSSGGFTWVIPQRKNVTEGDIFTVKSLTSGYHYVSMYQKKASVLSWIMEHYYVMLNLGSTALPYEPYVQPTLSNIYLGEVETTRKIKKLVLDGTENWSVDSEYLYMSIATFGIGRPYSSVICTHAQHSTINNTGKALFMKISDFSPISSVTDFKTYLQQQYAAGTPVIIWYVLAEPTTGIVNEPLRKIGDYADTVSGITIPTIAGTNTIDVDTTLKPSEVSVNYKGWHPVSALHRFNGTSWD